MEAVVWFDALYLGDKLVPPESREYSSDEDVHVICKPRHCSFSNNVLHGQVTWFTAVNQCPMGNGYVMLSWFNIAALPDACIDDNVRL